MTRAFASIALILAFLLAPISAAWAQQPCAQDADCVDATCVDAVCTEADPDTESATSDGAASDGAAVDGAAVEVEEAEDEGEEVSATKRALNTTQLIFTLLGALGVFIYGMKIMSESLQKVAGDGLKSLLARITSNPVSGLLTGFLVTCIIQSSSATTVMVVSFVNAQLLTLVQAIGVVMGANIGTTVTGWLVAAVGFKVKIAVLALPAIGLGFLMTYGRGARTKQWGEVLLGFGLLFLGLGLMKDAVPNIDDAQLTWITSITHYGFFSLLIFVFLGTALTVILQSSSATMTLTLTFAAAGLIPYDMAMAMILGENIGTTATANLAAIGASAAAKRTARAHFLFNIFGVLWALALFKVALLPLIDSLISGDPTAAAPLDGEADHRNIPSHIAMFHTLFNVSNSLLLIGFRKQIAAVVTKWVPDDTSPRPSTLRYISNTLVETPELMLEQVRQEQNRMADTANGMVNNAIHILLNPKADLKDLIEKTLAQEDILDDLEGQITEHLIMNARSATSASAARKIMEYIDNTHRLERIGDHCESLVNIARRVHEAPWSLDAETLKEIGGLADKVREAMGNLSAYLKGDLPFVEAERTERDIDATRARLRTLQLDRIDESDEPIISTLTVLDILTQLEEIGDRAFGIMRRIERTKKM